MELDSMTEDFKISLGDRETVQCIIGDILNPPARETDKVMMQRNIRIEARPFMSDIDLAYQAGFSKHTKRVIDGIA
jgi:hypothetical protein